MWYQCIDPPSPFGLNIKHTWDGVPVDFGDNVTYVCEHEGVWFEEDRDKVGFEVTCLPDGSFLEPDIWPHCVRSELLTILTDTEMNTSAAELDFSSVYFWLFRMEYEYITFSLRMRAF